MVSISYIGLYLYDNLNLTMPYKRIISLVPSLTELLIDLGLKDRLIGRTKFCIYPEAELKDIPSFGGTKNPKIQNIIDSNPDLIIANKEENRKEDIEELFKHVEVLLTEIDTIDQALDWISRIGNKLGIDDRAYHMVSTIEQFIPHSKSFEELKTAYFIWKDPWMTIGHDTYIHDVMKQYGLINVYGNQSRYPQTNFEELASLNPELILLSSEPYPFKNKNIQELQEVYPDSNILLINGEWFSWYGSRMIPSFENLLIWRNSISR